ncbi:hypothetical protein [Thermocatellispora tengchongensis]|uniref:hypothetical protein n=1 Tax=Thermocatellispora tengchongensis TaxID=1073253 RepID=UPI00363FE19B
MDAAHSVFGVGAARATRSMTGALAPAEIERTLDRFVPPSGFEETVRTLRERRVVVLVGPAESGKWTSSVALLDRVKSAREKIVILSPARALDDLATKATFRKGRGHVIHGWIAEDGPPALQRFEFDRLRARLEEADAHLVITLNRETARPGLEGYHVPWQPPDPLRLFDAHIGGPVLAEEITEVRRQAAELRSPRLVADLAREIASGRRAPADLLAELSGGEVAAWFGAGPQPADVLTVAALAFAHGVPERVFERLVADLKNTVEEVRLRGREPGTRPEDHDLPQSRAQWGNGHKLITVERSSSATAFGERRVVFRCTRYREQVIRELVDRYGYELWEPLRLWTRELAGLEDVRVPAVAGLALLAAVHPQEVRESFLEPWAGGLWPERLSASMLLSMMCADDALAPIALGTALSWVMDAGQPKAMTAALAFAGGLSIRYPADSVDWLWFLSLRALRVRTVARLSLTLLLQGAAERDGGALPALRLLARHVDEDLRGRLDPGKARDALAAVLAVLECERLETEDDPLAAWLLLSVPGSAAPLGLLWAWALRNAYHRGRAIRALRRTLRALEGKDGALAAATALGESVWSEVPDGVAALIKRAIEHAEPAYEDREASRRTRELVLAMLHAGSGRAPHR